MSLGTKTGRFIQLVRHGANPNLFDPNGAAVVLSSFEDYTYEIATDYDQIRRRGAKAMQSNVPLEHMHTGTLSGALYYNQIDDAIAPYLIAKAYSDEVVGDDDEIREREYRRPQFTIADREFFAVEEGKPTDCELGCHGFFTSFKFTSKRGNRGTARAELNFTTQVAVPHGNMTGGVAENARFRLSLTAATALLTAALSVNGGASEQFTANPWALAATIKSAIEAHSAITTVTVDTANRTQTAKVFGLEVEDPAGNYTIGGSSNLTTSQDLAAWQTAIRLRPGLEDAVLAGDILAGGAPTYFGSEGVSAPDNAFDGNAGTWASNMEADSFIGRIWAVAQTISKATINSDADGVTFTLQSSNDTTDGTDGTWTDRGTVVATGGTDEIVAAVTARAFRIVSDDTVASLKELVFVGANSTSPGVIDITITIPVTATNPDIAAPAVTGTNAPANLSILTPYAANGYIDVTVTSPAQTKVIATKVSGAGWTVTQSARGGTGIMSQMVDPVPMVPAHFSLYRSDTLAGLDDAGAFVGSIQEWTYEEGSIMDPVSHHTWVEDEARPDLPATYDGHAEAEDTDSGVKFTVTLDVDPDNTHVGTLLENAGSAVREGQYVSKPQYWRIVATCPDSVYRWTIEFYGSVTEQVPRKFGGNIEQRTFVFGLLENFDQDWALRWITRVPV